MANDKQKVKKAINPQFLRNFGLFLICMGILPLLICGIGSVGGYFTDKAGSGLAATGFLNIMLGIVFVYPDMLKGRTGSTSAMRVCVFMIICVFVVLVAKMGWATDDFADFKLDSTWAYVIGIALGAKTIQYFGEKMQSGPDIRVAGDDGLKTVIDTRKTAALGVTVLTPQSGTKQVPGTPPFHIQQALNQQR